jgi:uncharacterized membrane protein (TIGR02234 family)
VTTSASSRSRTVSLVLLGAGGALALLATTRPWVSLQADDALTEISVDVTGAAVAPLSIAVAVVAVAAVVAVPAVRGWLRRGVGIVVLVLAVAAFAGVVGVLADLTARARAWWAVEVGGVADTAQAAVTPVWPILTIAGLLVLAAGASIVVVRGGQWSGLSARYERSGQPRPRIAGSAAALDQDPWQALDRGEDPTTPD